MFHDDDGGFFVSDDYAKVIYRLSRNDNMASAATTTATVWQNTSVDPALASAGQLLYQQHGCDTCHGAAAATPVPLDALAEKYSVSTLAEYFLTPTPPMPTYDLSGDERAQLANFLLSRG